MAESNELEELKPNQFGNIKGHKKLKPQDWVFITAYTDYGGPTFGNAVASYKLAFPERDNGVAMDRKASAFKLRKSIMFQIEKRLKAIGLNDADVDMEHLKVIKQDKDLSVKMRGIQEYNRLKGRGQQDKQQIVVNILNYQGDEGEV